MPEQNIGFDEAMQQLERIINSLEKDELSLEKSVELYKKGMELSGLCRQKLLNVRGEITILKAQYGELIEKPFSEFISDEEEDFDL